MSSGPSAGAAKNVATKTVTPADELRAVWTWPCPGSTKAVPAAYFRSMQSSAGRYASSPETMLTTTGPRWECQGNCAPGCRVYLATSVRGRIFVLHDHLLHPGQLDLHLEVDVAREDGARRQELGCDGRRWNLRRCRQHVQRQDQDQDGDQRRPSNSSSFLGHAFLLRGVEPDRREVPGGACDAPCDDRSPEVGLSIHLAAGRSMSVGILFAAPSRGSQA